MTQDEGGTRVSEKVGKVYDLKGERRTETRVRENQDLNGQQNAGKKLKQSGRPETKTE